MFWLAKCAVLHRLLSESIIGYWIGCGECLNCWGLKWCNCLYMYRSGWCKFLFDFLVIGYEYFLIMSFNCRGFCFGRLCNCTRKQEQGMDLTVFIRLTQKVFLAKQNSKWRRLHRGQSNKASTCKWKGFLVCFFLVWSRSGQEACLSYGSVLSSVEKIHFVPDIE